MSLGLVPVKPLKNLREEITNLGFKFPASSWENSPVENWGAFLIILREYLISWNHMAEVSDNQKSLILQ